MRYVVVLAMLSGTVFANEPLIDKIDNNKSLILVALSVSLCVATEDRAAAVDELVTEGKYERETGVVRLRRRNELRTQIEVADKEAKAARDWLKKIRAKPLPCSSSHVDAVKVCLRGEAHDWCGMDEINALTQWPFRRDVLQADE